MSKDFVKKYYTSTMQKHINLDETYINKCKGVELSMWVIVDDYCATRVILGTDVNKVENRVAFIEKTGRVRVSKYFGGLIMDCANWLPIVKGDNGFDEDTRNEVDKVLLEMGYILN